MNSQEQNLKKFSLWFVILILGILVFFLIKPVFMSIVGGFLLAYVFFPAYKRLVKLTKRETFSAFAISIIIILIIFVPLWFLVPVMLEQVFGFFSSSQSLNIGEVVSFIFPTSSPQFISQMTLAINGFIGKITTYSLEYLYSLIEDIPIISLQLVIVFFVFFYGMRDSHHIMKFISELSPFNKANQKIIIEKFEGVTDSVIYGQVIVGLIQGGLAGLGFLIFGVPNVLILTFVAIILSILPVLGTFLVWIPVTIYFFISGDVGTGIAYLLYNIIIVTTADNILRTYLISKKADLSPAVVLVAMVGGIIIFGILGIFLGPLIVSYFIMFLHALKEKNLHSLITESDKATSQTSLVE